MSGVPEKLLVELAQLCAACVAQCRRKPARWLSDFLMVTALRSEQIKLKLLKFKTVPKLLPGPTISKQQRHNFFQDRHENGKKLLAAAAGRTEICN